MWPCVPNRVIFFFCFNIVFISRKRFCSGSGKTHGVIKLLSRTPPPVWNQFAHETNMYPSNPNRGYTLTGGGGRSSTLQSNKICFGRVNAVPIRTDTNLTLRKLGDQKISEVTIVYKSIALSIRTRVTTTISVRLTLYFCFFNFSEQRVDRP